MCLVRKVNRFVVIDNSVLRNILQYNDKLFLLFKIGSCRKGSGNSEEEEICKFQYWKVIKSLFKEIED